MKKQIISSILCICMILTLVPVFATATETPTTCNVLCDENFEDGTLSLDESAATADAEAVYEATEETQETENAAVVALETENEGIELEASDVSQYRTLNKEDFEEASTSNLSPYGGNTANNESVIATVDKTLDSNYGLGEKWHLFDTTADEKTGLIYQFAKPSKSIQNDADNIANNYKTELSFDFKMPEEITSKLMLQANNASGTYVSSGRICALTLNAKNETVTISDRSDAAVVTLTLSDYAAGTDFVNEVNRFRFVFAPHAVETINGKKYAGTITLYINGLEAYEGKYISNAKETAIAGLMVKPNGGNEFGYIDNIELIDYDDSTCAVDGAVAYRDRDKLVAAIRGAASTIVKAEQEKIELPAEFNDALTAAKNADAATDVTNDDLNTAAETLRVMCQGILNPISGKVSVESIEYSTTDLKTATVVGADIVVRTSHEADSTNHILALSVLYKNSDNYPGGEMLQASLDTAALGLMKSATLQTSLDLSGYTEAEKALFYVKSYVLIGEDRMTEVSAENAVLGSILETTADIDTIYGKKADLSKKIVADEVVFSLSAKTEKEDKILVYAVEKSGETNDELTDIAENNAKDKLVYFQISDVNKQGECSVLFKPKAEGSYRVVAYSQAEGKIYDNVCIYTNKATLTQTLTDLKNETVKIADVKLQMDIDTALFAQCDATGIEMDAITEVIFEENASANAYEFKALYSKYMNLLYYIKTADNLDTVTKTLNEHEYQNGMDSYDWDLVCEHVYQNRSTVTTLDALNTLLDYQPEDDDSDSSVGGFTGGFGGGGFGGGYPTTAVVDEPKTEEEAQTPYEENSSLFADIAEVAWAEEAILFLAKNNMINGKAEGVFAPNDAITREEFAKIVVNMFGTGKETEVPAFADVDAASWYYPYIVKAYADGIVKGIGEDVFGVGMQISREDAIVMLYRAGNLKGVSYSDKAEYIPFEDGCAPYAQEAVEALAKSGIITGTGNNMLSGGKTLTRAEAAKMVYGLYSFINQ